MKFNPCLGLGGSYHIMLAKLIPNMNLGSLQPLFNFFSNPKILKKANLTKYFLTTVLKIYKKLKKINKGPLALTG